MKNMDDNTVHDHIKADIGQLSMWAAYHDNSWPIDPGSRVPQPEGAI